MLYLLEIIVALSPTYVLRFSKIDLLELVIPAFWIIAIVYWARKHELKSFVEYCKNIPRSILISGVVFLAAALISTLVSPTKERALGEFIAYFAEPAITFFFAAYILRKEENRKKFTGFILVYAALLSVYGLIQYFTLFGLPQAWWGNANEPKRALSVFAYPNAFALFIAPLLSYALPYAFNKERSENKHYKWLMLLGLLGLIVSMSRGGWAGFAAAAIVFAFLMASPKIWKILGLTAAAAAIIIVIVPNFRYRVLLPFMGEKSTVSRYSLWHTADNMIESSPILGKGLNGFATNFTVYNTDPNLAPLDYPHNIFLNFWVETGILGLAGFILLSFSAARLGWKRFKSGSIYGLSIILFLTAIYIHGLADAPYFKNDLALIFWIIISTSI